MQLSVIIINYNVKHFLEQCLYSLQDAIEGIDAEIVVVDNNSTDKSVAYLQPRFPRVCFVANTQNAGFAKANNQALTQASGKYILYLNPDTLIPKEALKTSLAFMDATPAAGALGICMLDGSGKFLPESKRAFPAPLTSLFKLFGLAALFPTSRVFGRYYLGHLPVGETCEVDVLAGAFMLVRKKVLDLVGCFDETFFMYGEDIDLSYRIQKAGFKNYYFAGSSIIHFKGESTKKGSLNYVRMFYQAMNIFVQKHYSAGKAGFFQVFIVIAIWLRASISALVKFIGWLGLPFVDILLTLAAITGVAYYWQTIVKPGIVYPPKVVWLVIPLFTLVFIIAGSIAGLYDKWYKPRKTMIALAMAVIFNLAIYALFSESYRFSRGVILFGGLLASVFIIALRFLLFKTKLLTAPNEKTEQQRTLICGNEGSYKQVVALMGIAGRSERILGRVGLKKGESSSLGCFTELDNLLRSIPAKEIVFCINDFLPLSTVLQFMHTSKKSVRYKFFYENSSSIVGSDSKETSGETLSGLEHFGINDAESRRSKRVLDIACSLLLIVTWPIHVILVKKPVKLLFNCWQVLTGKKTWVGYLSPVASLPFIAPAILAGNGQPVNQLQVNFQNIALIDYWYAKDFDVLHDFKIILKAYRLLGS